MGIKAYVWKPDHNTSMADGMMSSVSPSRSSVKRPAYYGKVPMAVSPYALVVAANRIVHLYKTFENWHRRYSFRLRVATADTAILLL